MSESGCSGGVECESGGSDDVRSESGVRMV